MLDTKAENTRYDAISDLGETMGFIVLLGSGHMVSVIAMRDSAKAVDVAITDAIEDGRLSASQVSDLVGGCIPTGWSIHQFLLGIQVVRTVKRLTDAMTCATDRLQCTAEDEMNRHINLIDRPRGLQIL